ncbi:MAG: hypothetical protein ACLFTK_02910 [Anaerolineales bacterium]
MNTLSRFGKSLRAHPGQWLLIWLSLLPLYFTWSYIDTYGRSFPVNDQWLRPLDIAVATETGDLTVGMLVDDVDGHRAVFSTTLTAAVAWLTDWQIQYELYAILFFSAIRWIILFLLVRAVAPDLSIMALLPLSLLVFSPQFYLNWLAGVYSMWTFSFLFAVGALFVLTRFSVGWRAWGGALLLGVGAAFSQGAGLMLFPVMLLTGWMYGYRQPLYYVGLGAALALPLYAYLTNDTSTGDGLNTDTLLQDPLTAMRFGLAFLGNPFSYALDMDLPVSIGLAGLAVFLMNIAYLGWAERDPRRLAPWIGLAGLAAGVGAMVYLTRYTEDRFIYAIEQRYAISAAHFWIAVFVLGALAVRHSLAYETLSRSGLVMIGANIALLLATSALYTQANMWNWQATNNRYGHVLGYDFTPPDVECLRDFPLSRDLECLRRWPSIGDAHENDIYRLAYYDLSLYEGQTPGHILPEQAYQPGAPVVVDTPDPWMNAYVARWWLANVPGESFYHLAPDAVEGEPPLDRYANTVEDLGLSAALGPDVPTVWYIRAADQAATEADLAAQMAEAGYLPTVIPSLDARYNAQLTRIRFDRAPEDTAPDADFEPFRLVAWDAADRIAACETLTVQTWWAAERIPDYNAGVRVTLRGAQENIILAESAGGLTPVPTQLWSPEQLYLDERYLTLPCSAEPGTYDLLVSIFNPDSGELLPPNDDNTELAIVDDSALLADIEVHAAD